jgi:hypothetical protein
MAKEDNAGIIVNRARRDHRSIQPSRLRHLNLPETWVLSRALENVLRLLRLPSQSNAPILSLALYLYPPALLASLYPVLIRLRTWDKLIPILCKLKAHRT